MSISFDADCLFCKIVQKEIPAKIVYESAELLAFHDINPQAPVHLLIIPKQHIKDHLDVTDFQLLAKVGQAVNQLAVDFKLADKGFRVVNNCKKDGGQEVGHIHWHLFGGRQMKWPPG